MPDEYFLKYLNCLSAVDRKHMQVGLEAAIEQARLSGVAIGQNTSDWFVYWADKTINQ